MMEPKIAEAHRKLLDLTGRLDAEVADIALEIIAGMTWEYAAATPTHDRGYMMEDGSLTYLEGCAYWTKSPRNLRNRDGWRDHYIIVRRLVTRAEVLR